MKKVVLINGFLLFSIFLLMQSACKSDDLNIPVICDFATVNAELDSANQKLVHFTLIRDSIFVYPIQEIVWNFGDGNTVTNTDITVNHEYDDSGNYNVIIDHTVTIDGGPCTSSITTSVDIP